MLKAGLPGVKFYSFMFLQKVFTRVVRVNDKHLWSLSCEIALWDLSGVYV